MVVVAGVGGVGEALGAAGAVVVGAAVVGATVVGAAGAVGSFFCRVIEICLPRDAP